MVYALMVNLRHSRFVRSRNGGQQIRYLHFKLIPDNQIDPLNLTEDIKARLCITTGDGPQKPVVSVVSSAEPIGGNRLRPLL